MVVKVIMRKVHGLLGSVLIIAFIISLVSMPAISAQKKPAWVEEGEYFEYLRVQKYDIENKQLGKRQVRIFSGSLEFTIENVTENYMDLRVKENLSWENKDFNDDTVEREYVQSINFSGGSFLYMPSQTLENTRAGHPPKGTEFYGTENAKVPYGLIKTFHFKNPEKMKDMYYDYNTGLLTRFVDNKIEGENVYTASLLLADTSMDVAKEGEVDFGSVLPDGGSDGTSDGGTDGDSGDGLSFPLGMVDLLIILIMIGVISGVSYVVIRK